LTARGKEDALRLTHEVLSIEIAENLSETTQIFITRDKDFQFLWEKYNLRVKDSFLNCGHKNKADI